MIKKSLALLLSLALVLEIPFIGYQKSEVYAAAVVSAILGSEALWSAICTAGLACGFMIGDMENRRNIDEMPDTEAEAYSTQSAEDMQAVYRKLAADGYFDGTPLKELITAADSDGDCTASLEEFMKAKELDSAKMYEKKPDKDGKIKKVVTVSKELLKSIGDDIAGALAGLIEEKETEDAPYFPVFPDYGYKNYVIYLYDENYYLISYSSLGVFEPALKKYEYINGGGDYMSVFRGSTNYILKAGGWDVADIQFRSYTSHDSRDYTFDGNVTILYQDFRYALIHYHSDSSSDYTQELISANPYPWGAVTEPPSAIEIVRNYISTTNTSSVVNYNNDVYNYYYNTENNDNRTFWQSDRYLMDDDLVNTFRNLVIPASDTVVNNYYNVDDTDKDYINNYVIPSIVTQVNEIVDHAVKEIENNMYITDVVDFNTLVVSPTFKDYTYSGIEKYFPFSLPMDFIMFMSILDAEPVAPKFDFVLPLSVVGMEDYTIRIDLEPFEEVAEVCRTMNLFAGCVGLIFLTRKIIK